MNRALISVALLLLTSLNLAAQNQSSASSGPATLAAQPSTMVLIAPLNPNLSACPVGMQARHGVWDHTITVHRGEDVYKAGFGQRILLTLTNAHPLKVVAATLFVRGFNGKNRMMQTDGAYEGDATKILRTDFTESTDHAVSADLYISGFTAITSVRLMDVTYSDGSIWHSDSSNPCRVAPDPLMLIAAH